MGNTKIEWADKTINFYTWKCNKVSEGCKNCYMMALAKRRNQNPVGIPDWRENAIQEYNRLKSGDVVFVNSMSDTYHEGVPIAWVQRIHKLIADRPDVIFLLLTKRPEYLLRISSELVFPKNLFVGTSVENKKWLHRIDTLMRVPARGHFLSVEPLLESLIDNNKEFERLLSWHVIDWVIVGAESGQGYREFNPDWGIQIRDLCKRYNVPFMYKQGSGYRSGQNRVLEGRTYDETPDFDRWLVYPKKIEQLSLF